jgi:hypothetical protein
MKAFFSRKWVVVFVLVLASLGTIRASGPVAVYALVDRVVLEPNENAPTQIQIWGTFAVEKSPYSNTYSDPEKGYLYYKMDSSAAQATRSVWADLKNIAGTGEVVGFGGGYTRQEPGRVRKAGETAKNADIFPIGNPVTHLGASRPDMVTKLKAASQGK